MSAARRGRRLGVQGRVIGALLAVCLAALLVPAAAGAFSGENIFATGDRENRPSVNAWYHQRMTYDAATRVGFPARTAYRLAWHGDYIDSYNYSPLWWFKDIKNTGLDRFRRSVVLWDDLDKLHFDDLLSVNDVRRAWSRYLMGTLAGLLWARDTGNVEAARNILGISLHAVQDFYSHSSWINPTTRREVTWFDVADAERTRSALYTGIYATPERRGVHHHGKVAPECSLLKRFSALGSICSGISPLTKTFICDAWRKCQRAARIRPVIAGFRPPTGTIYLAPPGMALDTYGTAVVGHHVRRLRDITSRVAFNTAYRLARQSSRQWLAIVERQMQALGAETFWDQVKNAPLGDREDQFEDFGQVPFTFLSAGEYPPHREQGPNEWYLRLGLETSRHFGAGTNANIVVHAGGRSFELDWGKDTNPLIDYDDFEPGDDDSYVVGPFDQLPESIRIENRSATAGQALNAFLISFTKGIQSIISFAGDVLVSLVGGHADHIGEAKTIWGWDARDTTDPREGSPTHLAAIGPEAREFGLVRVNGRKEGVYDVTGSIRKVGEGSDPETGPYDEFEVSLDRLRAVRESSFDRGSDSDEPFLMATLVSLSGESAQKYPATRPRPYRDVDSGESRTIGHTFQRVRVPRDHGMLSLVVSIWESDDESATTRTRLLTRFAGLTESRTESARRGFIETLGASIGADWSLERISAFAFNRGHGANLATGQVLSQHYNNVIQGRTTVEFPLDRGAVRDHGVTAAALQQPVAATSSASSSGSAKRRTSAADRPWPWGACPF